MGWPAADTLKRLDALAHRAGRGEQPPAGLRPYAPGDDYRAVDWGLEARRGDLQTRVAPPAQDLRLDVLLDGAAGMSLGRPTKFDVARNLAALLGIWAVDRLGLAGLIGWSGGWVRDLPPSRGPVQRVRWLRTLAGLPAPAGQTDLPAAARHLACRRRAPGRVVVLTQPGPPAALAAALDTLRNAGLAPLVVLLWAADEARPAVRGDIELIDLPGGGSRPVLLTDRVVGRYRQLFAERLAACRRVCLARQTDCLSATVERPAEALLLARVQSQLSSAAPP